MCLENLNPHRLCSWDKEDKIGLFGVLDIDSDQPAFFNKKVADDLDHLMRKLFMGGMN